MLTLRRQAHSKDDRFWMVLCDDVPIGAIVQPAGLTAWHWSITIQANSRSARTGKSATREEAMTDLRAAWDAFSGELGPDGWQRHVEHMRELMQRAKQW